MNKKSAMSALGYAIVIVILLGIGMIVSTPMMLEKYKNPEHQIQGNSDNSYHELQELEDRLNSRISRLERAQTDRYVCTIEGNLDDDGNLVPIDNVNASEKFVFVCEYR